MDTYGYISSIALFCYIFMMLIFSAAKKNRLVNSFLTLMTAMIAWTGGSFLMRIQMWPSYIFWYHVSIAGLMLLTYAYYQFVVCFIGEAKPLISKIYFAALTLCTIVNIPSGIFLKWPEIVEFGGTFHFVYNSIDWKVCIMFGVAGVVVLHMFYILFRACRQDRNKIRQLKFIFMGIGVLFAGHLALMIPAFSGFPIDIVGGIINALLLMYALIKRRLFRLKLLGSPSICYGMGVCLSLVLFYVLSSYLDQFIQKYFYWAANFALIINIIFYTCLLLTMAFVWRSFANNVFIKEEILQAENLKEFSANVSKSLDLNTIMDEIIAVIKKTIHVEHIYICVQNKENSAYEIVHSDQPLFDRSFIISNTNPVITWFQNNQDNLELKDFRYSIEYKSMWEEEKRQLNNLNAEYCVALKDGDELAGIIFLSVEKAKHRLSYDDLSFMSSVSSIASIALKNARLYEKAYYEARTDELTGLLNRKYFYEVLQSEFDAHKDASLALLIINIDDFKLYNQLYGMKQSDEALRQVAAILLANVGDRGYVARYSGKEFAVLLPDYDLFSARNLAESIRTQIMDMNKYATDYKLKALTVSIGISAAPYAARSVKELVDNADMAVYHVKHHGKNGIMIFDMILEGQAPEKDHINVYQEYESTIYALTAAIDTKDHYTFTHSNNVAYYATELGKALGLNADMIEIIRQAALLHDVGKIGISEAILNKPGKLTDDEYEIIKGHVEASIGIIRHLPSLDYVIPAVIGHHERYDGRGYPRRIAGEDIPLTARILCIADSFDAMTSARCYKKALPLDKVITIFKEESGRQFDPKLADLFIRCINDGTIAFEEK